MSKATSEMDRAHPNRLETVDGSLIDEMLRLSPSERLHQNDRMAALAMRLRAAFGGAHDDGRAP